MSQVFRNNEPQSIKRKDRVYFWISETARQISFHSEKEFKIVEALGYEEMWNLVYGLIDNGYKVL